MATGDQTDFVERLRAVLPAGWFPSTASCEASASPILDIVLSGLASAWAWAYAMVQYAKAQTRIATATDAFLDMIAADYFGYTLRRRVQELDAAFSARIRASLLPPAGTRGALIARLTTLTGRAPVVFEPNNAGDTGGYGIACGYGVAGGYGSLTMPWQAFVTAYRPSGGGIASVAGFGGSIGGYGVGAIEYASPSMIVAPVLDSEIYATAAACLPANAIAWVNITN